MVDLMDPFWGWMALSVILGFVFIVMLIRLLAVQQVRFRFFLLLGAVGTMLLFSILSMVSTVGHARDLDGRHAALPLKPWFDSLRSGKCPCCSDADG